MPLLVRWVLSRLAGQVESDELIESLRGIGIDYIQGFGIAHPQPLY
jgi:EAL domain-containing protein (putative c-di-GMP-specific phosphodiesterase class I)